MLLNISSANDGNAAMMYESLPEEERLKSGGLVEYTAKVGKVYKAPGSIEGWTVFEGLREGEGMSKRRLLRRLGMRRKRQSKQR